MIDFSKIYCKTHPYELVTNFCKKESCLLGLCATCVCKHTEQHTKLNTNPEYQNIRETFTDMHRKVREGITNLQEAKLRTSALYLSIENKKNVVKTALSDARQSCITIVNQHFDRYLQEVQQLIISECQKNGYHNSYKLESLSAELTKQITTMIHCSQELNSTSFLDSIKRIKKETLISTKKFHEKAIQEIEQNQQYSPSIQLNQTAMKELEATLKKVMSVQFQYPENKLENGSNLCNLATQKSLEENKEQRKRYSNNTVMTFKQIPSNNQSEVLLNQRNNSSANLYQSQMAGDSFFRSNSSAVLQRGLSQTTNRWMPSHSPIYRTPITYSVKQVGPFMRTSNISVNSRSSSPGRTNPSFVSSMIPRAPQVFAQSKPSNEIYQSTNQIGFVPQYFELDCDPLTPIKKCQESNLKAGPQRNISKKGIRMCTTSDIMSEESKQNYSVASSVCSSVYGASKKMRI